MCEPLWSSLLLLGSSSGCKSHVFIPAPEHPKHLRLPQALGGERREESEEVSSLGRSQASGLDTGSAGRCDESPAAHVCHWLGLMERQEREGGPGVCKGRKEGWEPWGLGDLGVYIPQVGALKTPERRGLSR